MISSLRPWLKIIGVVFVLVWYLSGLLFKSFIKGKSLERGFRYRRKFCSAALKTLGIKYIKEGALFSGACLYVSNHRSMLDPLIELSWIDSFILSKAEVKDYPLLGTGAKESGVLFVDRDNHQSRKNALGDIESLLRSQNSVMIYPEGTTHYEDLTGEFRKGAIELAFDLEIPIVPVMIEYPDSGYYWAHEKLLDYFLRIFRSPNRITVKGKIGDPIHCEDKKDIVAMTQSAINQMILEARK